MKQQLLLQSRDLLRSVSATPSCLPASEAGSSCASSWELLRAELWIRLSTASLSSSSEALERLALAFAFEALGGSRAQVPYPVTPRAEFAELHLWRGIAHALVGMSLSSLEKSDRQVAYGESLFGLSLQSARSARRRGLFEGGRFCLCECRCVLQRWLGVGFEALAAGLRIRKGGQVHSSVSLRLKGALECSAFFAGRRAVAGFCLRDAEGGDLFAASQRAIYGPNSADAIVRGPSPQSRRARPLGRGGPSGRLGLVGSAKGAPPARPQTPNPSHCARQRTASCQRRRLSSRQRHCEWRAFERGLAASLLGSASHAQDAVSGLAGLRGRPRSSAGSRRRRGGECEFGVRRVALALAEAVDQSSRAYLHCESLG